MLLYKFYTKKFLSNSSLTQMDQRKLVFLLYYFVDIDILINFIRHSNDETIFSILNQFHQWIDLIDWIRIKNAFNTFMLTNNKSKYLETIYVEIALSQHIHLKTQKIDIQWIERHVHINSFLLLLFDLIFHSLFLF